MATTNKPVFKTTSKKPILPNYTVEFEDGEFIFNEGDLGTEMYIIHDGRDRDPEEDSRQSSSQLAVLEKGDFFGEMSILEDLPADRRGAGAHRRQAAADQRRHLRPDAAHAIRRSRCG